MRRVVRCLAAAAMFVAAVAVPVASVQPPSQRPLAACADGETGVTNGCAPFCLPHLQLDLNTGLCLPPPEPPPPRTE